MATETIAIVGCGDAKRDIGENETIPLKKLYTSNYFQLKHYFAEELCDRIVSLPMHPRLAEEKIHYVCDLIEGYYG